VKIGESILYECEDGKEQVGGDLHLRCVLNADLVVGWKGEPLICDNSNKIYSLYM